MDKQEILEYLVNRRIITDAEAVSMAELSLVELQDLYTEYSIDLDDGVNPSEDPGKPRNCLREEDYPDKFDRDGEDPDERIEIVGGYPDYPPEADDDPQCICGVYRSEHALCGCPEGFQTPESWALERDAICSRGLREDDYYDPDYCDDDRYPFGD